MVSKTSFLYLFAIDLGLGLLLSPKIFCNIQLCFLLDSPSVNLLLKPLFPKNNLFFQIAIIFHFCFF